MDKTTFCAIGIVCLCILQGVAWVMNMNGTIFAFTSTIIGGLVGAVLGFEIGLKKTPPK